MLGPTFRLCGVLSQKDRVPNENQAFSSISPFTCVLFHLLFFSLTRPTTGYGHLKLPSWELPFRVVSYVTLLQT